MRRKDDKWFEQDRAKRILSCLMAPKTPRQLEKELGLVKVRLKPFVDSGIVDCLNPYARKGKLYTISNEGRKYLNLPESNRNIKYKKLISWILASPKQRLALLKTLAMDEIRRTSEQLRFRAKRQNPLFTRISIKGVLYELISMGLVEEEYQGHKKYYWLSSKGRRVVREMENYLNLEGFINVQSKFIENPV